MDLDKLVKQEYTILQQEHVNECVVSVKETLEYRWFDYGGNSIQSLMNKAKPQQLMSPVAESLLFFLLIKDAPVNVLNLGLGGASFERALSVISDIKITSVEASSVIVDMAKTYFYLPSQVNVVCQQAELFIEQHDQKYDVVICDLFIDEHSADFIFTHEFYIKLKNVTLNNSVVMVNLRADTEEQLLRVLVSMKIFFPYIALMEFDDYKNIIVVGSSNEIPNKMILKERLMHFKPITFTSLGETIDKIRYIPHNNQNK